ncbi:hypothetical protein Y032_0290g1539 [Ancylostoma ceylanicum]|uniref:Uncharacterized protein n=1 Tax=Ancylostoma ceylanicum TaxID=53326 RepID=A0A016S6F3_9BILA|nr:hypothetical protein Y032_0290g1539 [Ancylostoma ceylanicum]
MGTLHIHGKTTVMFSGKNHPDIDFVLNGSVPTLSRKIRDLGITYTDDFNFNSYKCSDSPPASLSLARFAGLRY